MKPSDKESDKLRLQVFLSRNGVCSRRQALDYIQEGRVVMNGHVCWEPSTPVHPGRDYVSCDGKRVKDQTCLYVMLHKPCGYVTTKADRFAERTVFDLLPRAFARLAPVGRLDQDTQGLLLLTNDGDAAYRLTHPKFNVEKVYAVRVEGVLEPEKKTRLEKGVFLEGRRTSPARIDHLRHLRGYTEVTIRIHEGRKRQIRRMFASVGHKVVFLKRLAQGPLTLGALKSGEWRLLTHKEIDSLRSVGEGL